MNMLYGQYDNIEIWKRHPRYPHYDVSSFGRVRRLSRNITRDGIMSPAKCGKRREYWFVRPCENGIKHHEYIHHMVLETFTDCRPNNAEAMHLDGNPNNNRLNNLLWGTHIDNERHKVRHGTRLQGSSIHGSKLTANDIRDIRRRLQFGEYHHTIAVDYNVSRTTITNISLRKIWAHVDDDPT